MSKFSKWISALDLGNILVIRRNYFYSTYGHIARLKRLLNRFPAALSRSERQFAVVLSAKIVTDVPPNLMQ